MKAQTGLGFNRLKRKVLKMIIIFKSKGVVEAVKFADFDKATIQSIITLSGMTVNLEGMHLIV